MKKDKGPNFQNGVLLVVNLVVIMALYFVGVNIHAPITMGIYTFVFAAFSFSYVLYNRGFSRKNVTLEMLPQEWSPEKKTEFIEDGKRRIEKSKWMLTIIIPLLAVFGYELVDLYFLPVLKSCASV